MNIKQLDKIHDKIFQLSTFERPYDSLAEAFSKQMIINTKLLEEIEKIKAHLGLN